MSIQSEITRITNNVQDTIDVIEQTGVSIPDGANSDDLPSLAQALATTKQDKLTGTAGQVVGFDAEGNAEAQEAPSGLPAGGTDGQILTKTADGAAWEDPPDAGVTTFNGRSGAVTPQEGDYTADMVGARPNTWTPTASDVGAVPTSRTVNGKALSSNITLTADDVNAASPPSSTTITLTTSGWSANTQTVTVTGVLADEAKQLIQPMPAVASQEAYMAAGIYCSGQAANSLTFTCSAVPTEDISLYVVLTEVVIRPKIYGVEWDWTSSGPTKGVRTDDAASFGDPNPVVNNGTGSSPFDNLYPWSEMTVEERTGGTMVKEPKFWFKWTRTPSGSGVKLKLQIADGPVEGFHVDPVNMDRGDGLGELDFSYIGRYHCASGTYKSETNKAQQVSTTRSTARTRIHNLGSNIWQMDFAQFWYVNMLFLVEFADWNGQTTIGYGCSQSGSKQNNGRTDSMQYHTGTTAANRTTYGFTQYRNIEGWWDNVYDWMDGCYYNSNGLNVIKNPAQFSDSANGVLVGKPAVIGNGYPSDLTIPTQDGMEWALYPSAVNGSQTTYVPDSWSYYVGYPCLRHGSYYVQGLQYGPFCVDCGSASSQSSNIGCRLQERPPKE